MCKILDQYFFVCENKMTNITYIWRYDIVSKVLHERKVEKREKSCLLRSITPESFIAGGWYLRRSRRSCIIAIYEYDNVIVTCFSLSEIIFRNQSSDWCDWIFALKQNHCPCIQSKNILSKIWKHVNLKLEQILIFQYE